MKYISRTPGETGDDDDGSIRAQRLEVLNLTLLRDDAWMQLLLLLNTMPSFPVSLKQVYWLGMF